MLSVLRIRNLALVPDLTLEFQAGYNVITGETGAGKSILIGALNLVLGERADRGLLRSGADQCSVEAVFELAQAQGAIDDILTEQGFDPCSEGQLIVKRTFTAAGSNRQFINGSPTSLQTLARIGQWLVDIHGPHDHQSLLRPAQQLDILDAFGNLASTREEFSELMRRRSRLESEKSSLVADEHTYAQQLDLLRHQTREIASARLNPDEEAELEREHQRAAHAVRLSQLTQAALTVLADDEAALLTQAGMLGRTLREIQNLDSGAERLTSFHAQAADLYAELQHELSNYLDSLEVDPAHLQQMEERLNLIQGLKRKYGSTVGEVIEFGEEAQLRLHTLEQRDQELERLKQEIAQVEEQLRAVGRDLSQRRRRILPKLNQAVNEQLHGLGFLQAHFEVQLDFQLPEAISPGRAGLTGFDTVEFQFAPNPGEPAKPLRDIASSGELGRVMLALKTVLAVHDQVPVLVFDEVDANVGGEIAHTVGEKMCQIAQNRQVLCITHLAPVAAPAAAHFVVTKTLCADRTVSHVERLADADRVGELSRMLGGQHDAARRHAAALLSLNSTPSRNRKIPKSQKKK